MKVVRIDLPLSESGTEKKHGTEEAKLDMARGSCIRFCRGRGVQARVRGTKVVNPSIPHSKKNRKAIRAYLPSAGTETVPDVRTAVVPCVTETVETVPVAAADVVEPDAPAVTVEPLALEPVPLPAAMTKLSD